MKLRPIPVAVAILTTAAIALTGYGILLGLAIGFALGLLTGVLLPTEKSDATAGKRPNLPPYDPQLVQSQLEAAFMKTKRELREDEGGTETQIYQVLLETLQYLPATPVNGGVEIWDTVQREFLNPTHSDLKSSDREAMQRQIEGRCASFPLTLRALASTLLPAGTSTLASEENATFYLENLHAMPAIKAVAPGSAIEKLAAGIYFRVGDEVFLAKERFTYRCGSDVWHEVLGESLRDGSVKALEWEVDDHQLEILLQAESALGLDAVGLELKDLKKMDDREEGTLTFRGNSFRYDESDKATCQASGSLDTETFYYFDFINSNTKEVLGIERWGSEIKVYLMKPVPAKNLEIFTV